MSSKIVIELRAKATEFLNSKQHANNVVDIITYLKQNDADKSATMLALEMVFITMLKRRVMVQPSLDAGTPEKDSNPETKYHLWILERYMETLQLLYGFIDDDNVPPEVNCQALICSMNLLAAEGQYPLNCITERYIFPSERLSAILQRLCSPIRSQTIIIQVMKNYSQYIDIVYHSWKLLQRLVNNRKQFSNEIFLCNYLEVINCLAVTKTLHETDKVLCANNNNGTIKASSFEYTKTKKAINRVWNNIMEHLDCVRKPEVHKLLLIVLLERIMPHLEKPIELTDFLMDSLNNSGPISLLALQGMFTLIQKHNITYPNIYEKLYSMFEAKIFYTKYKARLFYLADIFLSSTHLPAKMVASFVKRLSRLALIAPPQDIVIILYFIGNLIIRFPALKRLVSAQSAIEVIKDPFIVNEPNPMETKAMDSSLWEIQLLQKHVIPSVATAARFIQQPLPINEWNLSNVLEIKEEDMFDQEIENKKLKQYTLALERPQTINNMQNYWKLF